jgi:2-C-methyl-D-erythritol 4-phosphate cytidylyltransferase
MTIDTDPDPLAAGALAAGAIAAIVPAAGSGRRFGAAQNKLCADLAGKPVWYHALHRLRQQPQIGRIVMPISAADRTLFAGEFAPLIAALHVEIIAGGQERTESVRQGLQHLAGDDSVRYIAVHDAARPLVSSDDLQAVFAAARLSGAAILAHPIAGTVKRNLGNGNRCETVDRRDLWIALTPQVFAVGLLIQAYHQHNGRLATDDAQLVERAGYPVTLVSGSADNLKITYPEDLQVAAAILARQMHDA